MRSLRPKLFGRWHQCLIASDGEDDSDHTNENQSSEAGYLFCSGYSREEDHSNDVLNDGGIFCGSSCFTTLSTEESLEGYEEALVYPSMPHMSHKPSPTPKHKAIKVFISSASSHIKKTNPKLPNVKEDDLCSEMLGNIKDRTLATAPTAP
eukprot:5685151-Ditylum_brightwellii.AAC.1